MTHPATELAGYVACSLVLLTFLTKDMRLLRIVAIFSNIAFISYATLAWLPPVVCLHLLLLAVNLLRLREVLIVGNRDALVKRSACAEVIPGDQLAQA